MEEIFIDKRGNDRGCVDNFGVNNMILMENAGGVLANFIVKIIKKSIKLSSSGDKKLANKLSSNREKKLAKLSSGIEKKLAKLSSREKKIVKLSGIEKKLVKNNAKKLAKVFDSTKKKLSKLDSKKNFSMEIENRQKDLSNDAGFYGQKDSSVYDRKDTAFYKQKDLNAYEISDSSAYSRIDSSFYNKKDSALYENKELNAYGKKDSINMDFIFPNSDVDSVNVNVAFLCGGGDNGADGLVASRILDSIIDNKICNKYGIKVRINVILLKSLKSELAHYQFKILSNFTKFSRIKIFDFSYFLESNLHSKKQDSKSYKKYNIFKLKTMLQNADIIVDCLFGSGFKTQNIESSSECKADFALSLENNQNYQFLRKILAQSNAIKIACDVPSGVANTPFVSKTSEILCKCDYTIAMGAPSVSLYDSRLKDIIGKIRVAPLGFNKIYYDNAKFMSDKVIEYRFYVLSKNDLNLPLRREKGGNKGTYGSVYVVCGEMFGAASLASKAAFSFGAGKSIILTLLLNIESKRNLVRDFEIIYSNKLGFLGEDSKQFDLDMSNEISTRKSEVNFHLDSMDLQNLDSNKDKDTSLTLSMTSGLDTSLTLSMTNDSLGRTKQNLDSKENTESKKIQNLDSNKDKDTSHSLSMTSGLDTSLTLSMTGGLDTSQMLNVTSDSLSAASNTLTSDKDSTHTQNTTKQNLDSKENTESKKIQNLDSKNTHNLSLAVGMGLGFDDNQYMRLFKILNAVIESSKNIPLVIDADMFYQKDTITLLQNALKHNKNLVLTPHPKEFLSLLHLSNIIESKTNTIDYILQNLIPLSLKFIQKFPNVTLLVKGANTFIAYKGNIYINALGTPNLAKGGSGDVLSGMIAALIAQGYDTFSATCNASLAHALCAKKMLKKYRSYALSPLKIIESLEKLIIKI